VIRHSLIGAEGTRLLENAIAFSSCVGRFEDVKISVLREDGAGGDPAGAKAPRRPRTARGKRSASRQAKTACPCGDYSKKLSLVERKSTD
jgi:hypothetical protein